MRDVGLLPIDSVARRINRESFLLLGGTAALVMQVAHPLVAAGIDEHSDFRRSPHGRLLRTLDTTLAIVYGGRAKATAAMRRINARHVPVRGVAEGGLPYDARDPALLLWVQSTLVLTSLRLYELVLGRLPETDRQRYWDEAKVFAMELGLPRHLMPAGLDDLERYERTMLRTTVVPNGASRTVARDVLRPFAWLPGPIWWPLDVVTAGLLPGPLRSAFGLRFGTTERLAFRAIIVGLRYLRVVFPEAITVVPQARRWEARVGGYAPFGSPVGSSDTK